MACRCRSPSSPTRTGSVVRGGNCAGASVRPGGARPPWWESREIRHALHGAAGADDGGTDRARRCAGRPRARRGPQQAGAVPDAGSDLQGHRREEGRDARSFQGEGRRPTSRAEEGRADRIDEPGGAGREALPLRGPPSTVQQGHRLRGQGVSGQCHRRQNRQGARAVRDRLSADRWHRRQPQMLACGGHCHRPARLLLPRHRLDTRRRSDRAVQAYGREARSRGARMRGV